MHDNDSTGVEAFLCAFLRGENPPWPHAAGEAFVAGFLESARYHGVLPLLHDRLQLDAAYEQGWPQQVLQACREEAIGHAMWELRHLDLLKQVLAKLAAASVWPVLFKGTALAYSLYPSSALRARGDTDLIVPPEALPRLAAVLNELGFERQMGTSGQFVAYQANFIRTEAGGEHSLDVHWRINNSELLSRLFSYQELLHRACPIPQLSPDALAAGTVDALLLACMHRATHKQNPYYVDEEAHYGGDRLIWFYDIHLLAGNFSQQDWEDLIRMAQEKGLHAVCLEGLELARGSFHTAIPEPVLAALGSDGKSEIVARYFEGGALRQHWMDFCAITCTADKMRFLAETLFPPASYMRHKYPQAPSGWLPWLYLRRAVEGMLKRLHRQGNMQ